MKEDLYEREEATPCNERKNNGGTCEQRYNETKNPSANVLPTEGYVLEVDGKFKSGYESSEVASKAGLELKKKYPYIQVKVYDAKERTRTLVELSAVP